MNKKIKIAVIRPGQAPEPVVISDALEELQKAVGGYIQIVPCGAEGYENCLLIIDEEGKFKGLEMNRFASDLFGVPRHIDYIVGTALLCGTDNFGDVAGLPRGILRGVCGNG